MSSRAEYVQLHQSPSTPDITLESDEPQVEFKWAQQPEKKAPRQTKRTRKPLLIGLAGLVLVLLFSLSHLGAHAPVAVPPSAELEADQQQQAHTTEQEPSPAAPVPAQAPAPKVEVVAQEQEEEALPRLPGRYLIAGYVTEQETKAMYHLYDLCMLARSLNRTFVLPQVESARFGYCRSRPFALFYEPDAISSFGCTTMPHEEFLALRASHAERPTAQVVRFQNTKHRDPNHGVAVQFGVNPKADGGFFKEAAPCLSPTEFDFTGRPPLRVGRTHHAVAGHNAVTEFGTKIVDSLLSWERRTGETEILIASVRYQDPFMTEQVGVAFNPALGPARKFEYLDYSHIWTAYAQQIADSLGPYIAVHWRSESLHEKYLPACGSALIDELLALQGEHPSIKTVYILMDYPLYTINKDGSIKKHKGGHVVANSDSFVSLSPAVDRAMQGFVRELASRAPSLRWTGMRHEEERLGVPERAREILATIENKKEGVPPGLDEIDRTLVGITDKLVAARAELFLSSSYTDPYTACGRTSSFTKNILSLREDAFNAQRRKGKNGDKQGALWNVGITWARPHSSRERRESDPAAAAEE